MVLYLNILNYVEQFIRGGEEMIIEDKKVINNNTIGGLIQNLVLENRGKLSVSGVNDVLRQRTQTIFVSEPGRCRRPRPHGPAERRTRRSTARGYESARSEDAAPYTEGEVVHPDLAGRRARPHGHVRHEAGRRGRVPRHLEADQDEGPRLRHHRDVPEAGEDHRQVLGRPVAAPRHRRPLRRRAPDAHRQGHGRQRGEHRPEVPRHRRHREP